MDDSQQRNNSDYRSILEILEKRARITRLALICLVYALLFVVLMVFVGVFYTKNNDNSPFGRIISTLMDSTASRSDSTNRLIDIIKTMSSQNESFLKDSAKTEKEKEIYSSAAQSNQIKREMLRQGDSVFFRGNNSQKIANSIASVLLSLSLMIFVGFVMKAILVFIRYYMQLGTDFENQKIAYVLSKGEVGPFNEILSNLRKSNINFEKTPNLPQEKIILSLIELLKGNKDKASNN